MGVILRKASFEDAKIILEWRNDRVTRENSFSKDIIDYETHIKWFASKLEDENCFMYMMESDEETVGQIRIDRVNGFGEISYMIAPAKRGMGYGKKILSLIENNLPDKVECLLGLVENQNGASKKCFEDNGYSVFPGGEITCFAKIVNADK
ncbi:MAG: GNAT family N-acetyltransferase [Lachnospiraceae bacterium]|nr:GNAT family N-acetyltransferase [Lachnospiraceae bacterium]